MIVDGILEHFTGMVDGVPCACIRLLKMPDKVKQQQEEGGDEEGDDADADDMSVRIAAEVSRERAIMELVLQVRAWPGAWRVCAALPEAMTGAAMQHNDWGGSMS